MLYDLMSPGHVLSLHEEAGKATLLTPCGEFCESDINNWGNRLLYHVMTETNGCYAPKLAADFGNAVNDFYEVSFGEGGTYRPDKMISLLGRRNIGDFFFVGGFAHPNR